MLEVYEIKPAPGYEEDFENDGESWVPVTAMSTTNAAEHYFRDYCLSDGPTFATLLVRRIPETRHKRVQVERDEYLYYCTREI